MRPPLERKLVTARQAVRGVRDRARSRHGSSAKMLSSVPDPGRVGDARRRSSRSRSRPVVSPRPTVARQTTTWVEAMLGAVGRLGAVDARVRDHPARVDHVRERVPDMGSDRSSSSSAARDPFSVQGPSNIDSARARHRRHAASTWSLLGANMVLFVKWQEPAHARSRSPRKATPQGGDRSVVRTSRFGRRRCKAQGVGKGERDGSHTTPTRRCPTS